MKISGEKVIFCGSRDIGRVMRGEEDSCCVLKSVTVYHSAYDLLDTETILPDLDPDFLDFLRGFDAYESIAYVCLNGETVLFTDMISGDVAAACNIGEMLPEIEKLYKSFCAGE